MCGIILFAYADGFHTANILGVLLSVGSAVGAAVYKVRQSCYLSDRLRSILWDSLPVICRFY